MAGFNNLTGDPYGGVMFSDNVCFDGTQRGTLVTTDGQLLIGSTVAPHIRVSTLTAGTGVTISNGNGTITISANAGVVTETLTGNSGVASPTAGNINVVTSNSTVKFVGSGSTLTQDFNLANLCLGTSLPSISGATNVTTLGHVAGNAITSGSDNTFIGANAGQACTNGVNVTAIGSQALATTTAASQSTAIGYGTLRFFTSASNSRNTALGYDALTNLLTGTRNIGLGYLAGSSYTGSESSNIVINSTGTAAESNVIRIGTAGSGTGQQSSCFVAGITGVTVAASAPVAVDTNGQLSSLGFGSATQVLTSNGAGNSPTWQAISTPNAFTSITVQTFTSNGTYTPTSGMLYCTIEVVGGGGGGGGIANGAASTGAGGGGAGGYARKTVSASTIGVSQSITIGAAGSAGSNTGGDGGTGGTTSVGSIVSATGGVGGTGSVNSNPGVLALGGSGGAGASGDFNTNGQPGQTGFTIAPLYTYSGSGGNSFYGGGSSGKFVHDGLGLNASGNSAQSYGGGGAGASAYSPAAGFTGGSGFAGIVVITEFI